MNVPEPPSDDEIHLRLRRAAERAKGPDDPDEERLLHLEETLSRLEDPDMSRLRRPLPDHDPEFEPRLRDLEARANRFKEARAQAEQKQQKQFKETRNDAQGLGKGLAIVYAFIGFPLIGAVIGFVVKHYTNSSLAIPGGGFIGLLAGCLAAFVLLRWSDERS